MNFKLDLSEIDIHNIDFDNMGGWPKSLKIIFALITAVIVCIGGYFLLVDSKITELSNAQSEEQRLRQVYRVKYASAVNLELYRQQMADMENLFATLLKRLPTSHETPGLLDDITYVGTSAGLTFVKMNWLPEVAKEFYTELPITMEVVGSYHEFGNFVSKVAKLPRIVTLHDFKVRLLGDGKLNLSIVAKTYRYKGDPDSSVKQGKAQ
jgi:type IV pilus assembly protein PilO